MSSAEDGRHAVIWRCLAGSDTSSIGKKSDASSMNWTRTQSEGQIVMLLAEKRLHISSAVTAAQRKSWGVTTGCQKGTL